MNTLNKINQIFFGKNVLSQRAAVLVLASAAVILSGCARDKDLAKFQADEAKRLMGQAYAAKGDFWGTMNSKLDGKSLGSLGMTVKVVSVPQTGPDGMTPQQKPLIQVSLDYRGKSDNTVPPNQANPGYFNPDTGDFSVQIPVVDESNLPQNSKNIVITGTINAGRFVGEIYMDGQEKYGARLDLSVGTPKAKHGIVDSKGERVRQLAGDSRTYSGTYPSHGVTRTATMTVRPPSSNPQQQLLRILNPQRLVSVNFNLGIPTPPMISFSYQNTFVDDNSNQLSGIATLSNGANFDEILKCSGIGADGVSGWHCTVEGAGEVIEVDMAPTTAKIK